MNTVYLMTGGNIGDRLQYLNNASVEIERLAGKIVAKSSIYETEAWGYINQQPFLNQVLKIETELQPSKLLQTLLEIELQSGRERKIKMGPRTIDIDILFYNNEIITTPTLTIPHSQIQNRRFVLTPLNEIAANLIHPVLQKNIAELLNECMDKLQVNKIKVR